MVRVSRRCAAALLAGACLVSLGACSPTSGADTDQATTGDNSASSAVQQTGESDPTTGTQAVGVTSTGPTTTGPTTAGTSSTSASSTPTSIASALPGGTSPTAALAQSGYVRDGKVDLDALREAAEAGAFTAGDSSADNPTGADPTENVSADVGQPATDLCNYLFGTADQVAALTRLTGAIHLAPPSGPRISPDTYQRAGETINGLLIACVYADDAGAQVVLQVSDGPPVDPELPGHPIIVTDSGESGDTTGAEVQAVISYRPDRTEPRIDQRVARDWLTATLGRATAGP